MVPIVGDGDGGATSISKTGSGTWVLSALNTYTGPTTITAGTLRYGGSDLDPTTPFQVYTLSPANPAGNQNVNATLGMGFNVNAGKSPQVATAAPARHSLVHCAYWRRHGSAAGGRKKGSSKHLNGKNGAGMRATPALRKSAGPA